MSADGWEHFSHDADVGIRGFGATPGEAFAHAALAMMAVITDPDNVRPLQSVEIECAAPDLETLFVDWLNRLVFEMATRKFLFSQFDVAIDNGWRLTATAHGEPVDEGKHEPAAEIKGATFTALSVAQDRDKGDRWNAQCVLDV